MSNEITNEDLARMMQNEFSTINEKLDDIRTDIKSLKEESKSIRKELEAIKTTMEEHKMRLDEMAPYFEVRDLDKRLKAVEKKLGISS